MFPTLRLHALVAGSLVMGMEGAIALQLGTGDRRYRDTFLDRVSEARHEAEVPFSKAFLQFKAEVRDSLSDEADFKRREDGIRSRLKAWKSLKCWFRRTDAREPFVMTSVEALKLVDPIELQLVARDMPTVTLFSSADLLEFLRMVKAGFLIEGHSFLKNVPSVYLYRQELRPKDSTGRLDATFREPLTAGHIQELYVKLIQEAHKLSTEFDYQGPLPEEDAFKILLQYNWNAEKIFQTWAVDEEQWTNNGRINTELESIKKQICLWATTKRDDKEVEVQQRDMWSEEDKGAVPDAIEFLTRKYSWQTWMWHVFYSNGTQRAMTADELSVELGKGQELKAQPLVISEFALNTSLTSAALCNLRNNYLEKGYAAIEDAFGIKKTEDDTERPISKNRQDTIRRIRDLLEAAVRRERSAARQCAYLTRVIRQPGRDSSEDCDLRSYGRDGAHLHYVANIVQQHTVEHQEQSLLKDYLSLDTTHKECGREDDLYGA